MHMRWLLLLLTFISTMGVAAVNDAGVTTQWGYLGRKGPEFWSTLNPAFVTCSLGQFQSPIDINKAPLEAEGSLTFSYEYAPFVIEKDGETELTLGNSELLINTGHGVQLNFDEASNQSILYQGKRYKLVQLNFHSPSEMQMDGSDFPLEIQLLHQGSQGSAVIVVVFVKGGDSNPTLQKIVAHVPKVRGKEVEIKGQKINPMDLLPPDKSFYAFNGSLTTPPCTEGVQWVVIEDPITASPAQIMAIRQAAGGANARGVQPLNDRVITYSEGKSS